MDKKEDPIIAACVLGNHDALSTHISGGWVPPDKAFPTHLALAALNGHPKCVELLIPLSNVRYYDSKALVYAAISGNSQCVELLIPVSDIRANWFSALRVAAKHRYSEIVTKLVSVIGIPDAGKAVSFMKTNGEGGYASLVEAEILKQTKGSGQGQGRAGL